MEIVKKFNNKEYYYFVIFIIVNSSISVFSFLIQLFYNNYILQVISIITLTITMFIYLFLLYLSITPFKKS